jgi:hypothetical protein
MNPQRTRNLIPPIYALAVLAAFLISATAGVIVLIVGGSLSGLLWSAISRHRPTPVETGTREDRAAARAERRSERR